ncbi:hypothetical protein HGB69_004449 [Salmonella enterica]|nr:hypothetical protein [Salmonella enterica]
MRENLNKPAADELPRLRDQCGALALELERETDPTRRAELARELAECRQRVFQAEQADQLHDREAGGPAGDVQPAQVMRERIEGGNIEAADPRPDYAGLYAAERAENAELRAELAATEGQGISRERERLHSAVEHAQEQQHAEELSHAGVSPELAAEYEARILARDESFAGEVVQQIERDDEGRAFVIEADGDRVMVPQIEGAEMDVGDDVEVSRDHQGNYEAETGYGYGR